MTNVKNVRFSLKAIINKEKNKVLFVEAGGDFVDVLLSFLTMPLGKVVKVLEKHYGVESPVIGSLNGLYKGFLNLHSDHFWTEGCKQMLLNPRSSFEAECCRLKLDITGSRLPEFFRCGRCKGCINSVISMYYDAVMCGRCLRTMTKERHEMESDGGGDCEVFIEHMAPFIISDDLHVFPEVTELMQIISILGITDLDGTELTDVTFGVNEIVGLLKASICSPTPLSDVILNQKLQMKPPAIVKSEHGYQSEMDAVSNSEKMILKVVVQKSTNKILYGRAGADFIDFLTSFLAIPLGGIVSLLSSNNESSFKNIHNLYKSVADLIDCKFFKTKDMKNRFTGMKLAHGSISKNQILPLTEEYMSFDFGYRSDNFPQGKGKYVKGFRTYMVADDLTVTPFSVFMLSRLNIPLSDMKEVELQIGPQEALNILQASLSSTCVLSNALNINSILKKPKQEDS